jgi:hypothetical protein
VSPPLIRGIGFAVACAVTLVAAVHFLNLTMDDAFISFRYAENLAGGLGLVFNAGERVEGYTNFLWTLLLAVPALFGAGRDELGMLITGKILSLLFTLGSLAVVCWEPAATSSRRKWAALPVGALFLATTAPSLVWSMGALEGPMVGFLIALSLTSWRAETEPKYPRTRIHWSALWLALAAMTRPEPVLLIAPLFVLRLLSWPRSVREAWREQARYLLTFAVPVALFLLWRWAYYGALLPNTYYAKRHGDTSAVEWGLRYLNEGFERIDFLPIAGTVAVVALLARTEKRWVAALFSVCAIQLAGVAYEGGDWMPALRLVVPTFPVFALLLNVAWRGAVNFELSQLAVPVLPAWVISDEQRGAFNDRLESLDRRAGRALNTLIRGMALLSLSASLVAGAQRTWSDWVGREGSGFSSVHLDSGLHFTVARWIKQNVHEPGLLATGEIGVVPYYTKLPVLDLFGLTDVHIAHLQGTRHSKFDLDYVLQRAPRYVYLLVQPAIPGKPRRAQQNHGRLLLESPEFQSDYAVLQDFGEGILYERQQR